MSVVLLWLPDPVARIYTSDEAIRLKAVGLLQLAIIFIGIDIVAVVTAFGLRAFKDTRFPFLVMTIAYWMLTLPLGYQLGLTDAGDERYGALGFWWAMIAGVSVAALLTSLRLRYWLNRPLPSRSAGSPDYAPEANLQGPAIEQQQGAEERPAKARQHFDRFQCLQGANDPDDGR